MSAEIKRSAIPYAGYRYQTLQGLALLAEWLASPTRYRAVRFECDDTDVAPQALDDIVAVLHDGRQDYTQVKYTPDAAIANYPLSWDWLLAVDTGKKKARSLIKKWSDAFRKISPGQLGQARLITNREPDREIARCLSGDFIDYTLVSPEIKAKLDEQLGGAASAQEFLSAFKIQHSDRSYLSLERSIVSALRRLGFEESGIERLTNRAHDWSILKNYPEPEGWITLEIVRAVLSAARPVPIPEDFSIPAAYALNDDAFHQRLLGDIKKSAGEVFTVVGPPGRGKSTYLSFLCRELEDANIPIIRHHYFLSVRDKSPDRLSPYVVADSLLSQISRFHADAGAPTQRTEDLAPALKACAAHYKQHQRPFVVVIDGLDHVWRDNSRDKRPLDEIFRQLLPVVSNLVVIVGTQPVDDDKLPDILLIASNRPDWRTLPPMSVDAVFAYVQQQVEVGRWMVHSAIDLPFQLGEMASALHALTKGHPLHVIYSAEHLLAMDRAPQVSDIEMLPACPGDDIREYYLALWQKLTHPQRDALHLLCAYPFYWPRRAFTELPLAPVTEAIDVRGIQHLLHDTSIGLKPFHESLIVFVKEEPSHDERVSALSAFVEEWLRDRAPPVLREGWLWTVQTRRDNSAPMIDGLTRDWVLDRLASGYSTGTFVRLLGDAEHCAFASRKYGRTYELRSLKTRLLNGPDFQIDDATRLAAASWTVCPEQSVVDDIWVGRQELSTYELTAFGLSLHNRGEIDRAMAAVREATARFQSEFRLVSQRHTKGGLAQRGMLFRAAIAVGQLTTDKLTKNNLDEWPRRDVGFVANALAVSRRLTDLIFLRSAVRSPARARLIEDAAIRTAAVCGGELPAWEEFAQFGASSLAACWRATSGHTASSTMPHTPLSLDWTTVLDWDNRMEAFDDLVREWFLKSVAVALYADGPYSPVPAPPFDGRNSLSGYLDDLQRFAAHAANELTMKRPVDFSAVFGHFKTIVPPSKGGYDEWQVQRDFRRTLVTVALDCHFVSTACGGSRFVTLESLRSAESSQWFNPGALRSRCVSDGFRVLTDDAAAHLISACEADCWGRLEETSLTAETLLELCELAILYEMPEQARRLCRLCWDIVLGYGHRKDPAMSSVLSAIEYLAPADPKGAKELLFEIAPQIHSITDYTDGKGTRHAHGQASELLAKLDRYALMKQYRGYTAEGSWYYAENALRQFVVTIDSNSPISAPLMRTGLSSTELGLLIERSAAGDETAHILASAAADHLGATIESLSDKPQDSENTQTPQFAGDPAAYPPEDFVRLLEDIRDSQTFSGYEYLPRWFAHWESSGKASSLIRNLTPVLLADEARQSDTCRLLDQLFDVTVQLAGRSQGFNVAVKAQIDNGGWGEFWESAKQSEDRLRKVAAYYAERADEFIAKSTKNWLVGRHNPTALVVPGEKLVFFLVELGRLDEARELLRSMVQCLKEDTQNLQLPTPTWAQADE